MKAKVDLSALKQLSNVELFLLQRRNHDGIVCCPYRMPLGVNGTVKTLDRWRESGIQLRML